MPHVPEGSEEEGFIRVGGHAEQSSGLPRVPEDSEEEGFISDGDHGDGTVAEQGGAVEIEARSTAAVRAERFSEGGTGGGEMAAVSPAMEAGLETTGGDTEAAVEAAVEAGLEVSGRGEENGIGEDQATAATAIGVMASDGEGGEDSVGEDVSMSSSPPTTPPVAGGDEQEGD